MRRLLLVFLLTLPLTAMCADRITGTDHQLHKPRTRKHHHPTQCVIG